MELKKIQDGYEADNENSIRASEILRKVKQVDTEMDEMQENA